MCRQVVLIAGLVVLGLLLPTVSFCKEPHPLQGGFMPGSVVAEVGTVVDVVLVVEPLASFDRVELRFAVPPSIALLAGETTVELKSLKPKERRRFPFRFQVKTPGEIELMVVAAVLDLPGEQIIQRGYLFTVNPKPKPQYKTKTTEDGHEFIEIELSTD